MPAIFAVSTGFARVFNLWPEGDTQPLASTLNASDGAVTSNMAIVETDTGSIDAFAYSTTDLIIDLFGYFAPSPMGAPQ